MRIPAGLMVLTVVVLGPGLIRAAEPKSPEPAAAPWVEMDYGPFMSLTLEAPRPAGNFAYKGIVIPLRPDRSAAMVFDTDLLRWSAGWSGSFIDWKNILYDGSHNTHCRIVGDQAFGTMKRPGWARPGGETFDDPRPFPHGPIPRDWGRWKGLYRHGDRVVLSYRVGESEVLETAELLERDGTPVFARHLRIGPRKLKLLAAVSDTPLTRVELVGGGAALVREGDHVRLSVPVGEKPADVTLMIAAGGDGVSEALKRLVADGPASPIPWEELQRGGPARYKPIVTRVGPGKKRTGGAFSSSIR